MPTKVFTTIDGLCPFGKKVMIDSPTCRSCEYFYRMGTGTFFWCNNPVQKSGTEPKKRGRPPGKAKNKPVKRKTKTK